MNYTTGNVSDEPFGLQTCLVRGSAKRLASSLHLGWEGFGVEHHIVLPGHIEETHTDLIVVNIAAGNRTAYGERSDLRGGYERYVKEPQTLGIFPSRLLPAVCPLSSTELIGCAFEPRFIAAVAEEDCVKDLHHMPMEQGVSDPPIVTLGQLLIDEVTSGGVSGSLYAEHLAQALVLRLLKRWGHSQKVLGRRRVLPETPLRKALDMMRGDPARNWSLAELAQECGLSRNHLIRVFRAATGSTPHRFLLQLRIEKAKGLMPKKKTRMIDIAASCGFSSEAHLSRTFRSVVGLSPRQYRSYLAD